MKVEPGSVSERGSQRFVVSDGDNGSEAEEGLRDAESFMNEEEPIKMSLTSSMEKMIQDLFLSFKSFVVSRIMINNLIFVGFILFEQFYIVKLFLYFFTLIVKTNRKNMLVYLLFETDFCVDILLCRKF